jgi:hypothetical protein
MSSSAPRQLGHCSGPHLCRIRILLDIDRTILPTWYAPFCLRHPLSPSPLGLYSPHLAYLYLNPLAWPRPKETTDAIYMTFHLPSVRVPAPSLLMPVTISYRVLSLFREPASHFNITFSNLSEMRHWFYFISSFSFQSNSKVDYSSTLHLGLIGTIPTC